MGDGASLLGIDLRWVEIEWFLFFFFFFFYYITSPKIWNTRVPQDGHQIHYFFHTKFCKTHTNMLFIIKRQITWIMKILVLMKGRWKKKEENFLVSITFSMGVFYSFSIIFLQRSNEMLTLLILSQHVYKESYTNYHSKP